MSISLGSQLIQVLQVILMSGAITTVVMLRSLPARVSKIKIAGFLFITILLINFGWNIVLVHYCGEMNWFQAMEEWFNLIVIPINYYVLYLLYDTSFCKLMIALIISNALALPMNYLPIRMIYCISGENIAEFESHALDIWNIVLFAIHLILILLLWKFGTPLFLWIRELRLKNQLLWNAISISYILIGIVALYKDKRDGYVFLIRDMVIVFSIMLLLVYLGQRYYKKQLDMENHFLKTQQALMQEHYEAMEHYIAQTESYREEIEEQMKTIEEITRDVHDPRLDGYLGALRKQYEEISVEVTERKD